MSSVEFVEERERLLAQAAARIRHVHTVVDVGSGIRPQDFFRPAVHICIDPFPAYLDRLKEHKHLVLLRGTWNDVLPLMPDESVDTVFLLDVIEHVEKEEGLRLLAEAERIARCQVIVFTPYGFYPQSYEEGQRDRWGMNGGYWQTHRSGWLPGDFGEGWDLLVCKHFHEIDQYKQRLAEPVGAIFGFRNLSEMTGG